MLFRSLPLNLPFPLAKYAQSSQARKAVDSAWINCASVLSSSISSQSKQTYVTSSISSIVVVSLSQVAWSPRLITSSPDLIAWSSHQIAWYHQTVCYHQVPCNSVNMSDDSFLICAENKQKTSLAQIHAHIIGILGCMRIMGWIHLGGSSLEIITSSGKESRG